MTRRRTGQSVCQAEGNQEPGLGPGSARRPAGDPTRLDRLMPGLAGEQRLRRKAQGFRKSLNAFPEDCCFYRNQCTTETTASPGEWISLGMLKKSKGKHFQNSILSKVGQSTNNICQTSDTSTLSPVKANSVIRWPFKVVAECARCGASQQHRLQTGSCLRSGSDVWLFFFF